MVRASILILLIVFSCKSSTVNSSNTAQTTSARVIPTQIDISNVDTRTKLENINRWYKTLVIERLAPIFVFQTEVYNKDDIYLRGSRYRYEIIEYDQNNLNHDSDDIEKHLFIQTNFAKSLDYLKKHVPKFPSKIFLQIPYRTSHHSRDMVGEMGREQQVVRDLTQMNFIFDISIASLVDSKKYDPDFNSTQLPPELIHYMEMGFEQIKQILPENYRQKVQNSRLLVTDPNDEKYSFQRLSLLTKDTDVSISTYLFRAIIVKAITKEARLVLDYDGSSFKYKTPVQLLKISDFERNEQIQQMNSLMSSQSFFPQSPTDEFIRFKKPEIDFAYKNIIEDINSTLIYLFLHEFSHIYLGPNELNEFRCDCYAYKALINNQESVNFGIFQEMMVEAINKGHGIYWQTALDSAKIQEIINRYDRVKKIDSMVKSGTLDKNFDCDNLPF